MSTLVEEKECRKAERYNMFSLSLREVIHQVIIQHSGHTQVYMKNPEENISKVHTLAVSSLLLSFRTISIIAVSSSSDLKII